MKPLCLVLVSSAALAQARAPEIRFELVPPLVEVLPGVQVVEDQDDEIFSTAGSFWVRHEGSWYRSSSLQDPGWAVVQTRDVPAVLINMQPGRYRRWKKAPPPNGEVAAAAEAPPAPPGTAVRARRISASRVKARVIFCNKLNAGAGTVARREKSEGRQDWGRAQIVSPEVNADTIYAKEIYADTVEAGATYCKQVKIGP
jgi:hypothetical protein